MKANAPFLVELAGPAGAGKSTLCEALEERSLRVKRGLFPDVRTAASIPFYARNILVLLPTLATLYRHRTDRFLTWGEVTYLAIINGWLPVLTQQSGIIVLDQGPVYMVSELLRFGPQALMGPAGKKWWNATCKTWAGGLDLIVYLDAPDTTLVSRILNRKRRHGIKEHDNDWATAFLARSRWALDKVLSGIALFKPELKIIRMDTSVMSLDETLDSILAVMKEP